MYMFDRGAISLKIDGYVLRRDLWFNTMQRAAWSWLHNAAGFWLHAAA